MTSLKKPKKGTIKPDMGTSVMQQPKIWLIGQEESLQTSED